MKPSVVAPTNYALRQASKIVKMGFLKNGYSIAIYEASAVTPPRHRSVPTNAVIEPNTGPGVR